MRISYHKRTILFKCMFGGAAVLMLSIDFIGSLDKYLNRFSSHKNNTHVRTYIQTSDVHETENVPEQVYLSHEPDQRPDRKPRDKAPMLHSRDQPSIRQPRDQAPVSHVGFLKVHKAGSSTIQNILFRYALKSNLTLILPRKRGFIINPYTVLSVHKGNHYDMLACHTIYSEEIFGLLPMDTVRISMIRDPLDRAISAAYFYRDLYYRKNLKIIPRDRFIEHLIMYHEIYDPKLFSETKNAMGMDFGFSLILENNKTDKNFANMKKEFERQPGLIKSHLNRLEKEFGLVMVVERFEESLILLKRTLKWRLQDIIFVKKNSHNHDPVNITDAQKLFFRNINFIDYAIYDTFYPIFDEKVKAEGPSFIEEVDNFRSILNTVQLFCAPMLSQYINGSINIPPTKWNEAFGVSRNNCDRMMKKEIDFIQELRIKYESNQNI